MPGKEIHLPPVHPAASGRLSVSADQLLYSVQLASVIKEGKGREPKMIVRAQRPPEHAHIATKENFRVEIAELRRRSILNQPPAAINGPE